MRIAFVLPTLSKRAGWRTHASGLINALQSAISPILFTAEEDKEAAQRLFPGMPVYSLPATQSAWFSSRRGGLSLLTCYYHIRRAKFPPVDLVHSLEAYPTGLVGHWLTQRLSALHKAPTSVKVPHVITCHGTYGIAANEHFPDRLFYRQVLRNTQALCPVSQGTASQVRFYFSKELVKTMIVPILNGNHFYKRVSEEVVLTKTFPTQPVLLSVGDVKPRKGQDTSLEAFAIIKKWYPEAQYWIVGDPHKSSPFYQQLEKFIQENNLEDARFLGHVTDQELEHCYQEASVFVLTPRQVGVHFEGFGLVYLEAGAYGLPVVATRSGGVAEAVIDGQTGLLAEEGDAGGVASALIKLVEDQGLAKRLGQANRQWAETLTWERAAEEQVKVYDAVLSSNKVGEARQ